MKHYNSENDSPEFLINKTAKNHARRSKRAAAAVIAASVVFMAACTVQQSAETSVTQTTEAAGQPGGVPLEDEGVSFASSTADSSQEPFAESSSSEPSEAQSSHQHEFGEFVTVSDPDCTNPGKALAACECGETTAKEIPALGHEYVLAEQNGLMVHYKCVRCGDEITETKPTKSQKMINDLNIYVEDEHTYDGKVFRPEVRIMDGDEDVTASSRIEYNENAVNVGAYFLTVYMNGYYSGSRSYEYKIFPESPRAALSDERDDGCTVSWESCAAADGYILEYSDSRDFSDVQTVTLSRGETTCSIDGLDKTVPCYIRVRSFADVRVSGSSVRYRSHFSETVQYGRSHIEVIDGITYVDGILIANKTYSLPSDYDPGFRSETQSAFNEMAADAAKDGIYLFIVSGYRSYSTQYSTYNYFVYDRGKEQADRCSARPGHSEHQTGLACDINSTSSSFEGTPEAEWIDANCWKYGFIVRYPKGKEEITGYKYEPWHVRYLGRELAKKVYDSGLTLEEYLGITSVYSY